MDVRMRMADLRRLQTLYRCDHSDVYTHAHGWLTMPARYVYLWSPWLGQRRSCCWNAWTVVWRSTGNSCWGSHRQRDWWHSSCSRSAARCTWWSAPSCCSLSECWSVWWWKTETSRRKTPSRSSPSSWPIASSVSSGVRGVWDLQERRRLAYVSRVDVRRLRTSLTWRWSVGRRGRRKCRWSKLLCRYQCSWTTPRIGARSLWCHFRRWSGAPCGARRPVAARRWRMYPATLLPRRPSFSFWCRVAWLWVDDK